MEIAENAPENNVLATARRHKTTSTYRLADGTVKKSRTSRVYIPKTDRKVIDDAMYASIVADYKVGVTKVRIAKKYGIGITRVNNICEGRVRD